MERSKTHSFKDSATELTEIGRSIDGIVVERKALLID